MFSEYLIPKGSTKYHLNTTIWGIFNLLNICDNISEMLIRLQSDAIAISGGKLELQVVMHKIHLPQNLEARAYNLP